jgi:hypothetical protein
LSVTTGFDKIIVVILHHREMIMREVLIFLACLGLPIIAARIYWGQARKDEPEPRDRIGAGGANQVPDTYVQ